MDQSVEELQAKLAVYREQLSQVEELLQGNPDNDQLLKIKGDLVEVIAITTDLASYAAPVSSAVVPAASTDVEDTFDLRKDSGPRVSGHTAPSLTYAVGTKVSAQYQVDKVWYPATITTVHEDGTYTVTYDGYGNVEVLHGIFIKAIRKPALTAEEVTVGMKVQACYSVDGVYYNGVVESITDEGYVICYSEYGNKEVRQLEHLRPPPKVILVPKVKVAKKEEEDILTAEFVIPDNLRLLPTDTEEVKKRKRKKVKALKANFVEKKTTAEESQVRNEWESFKSKAAKKKPVGALSNLKKESIFKSPDEVGGKVGVTGSGQGLTEYDARKRQRLV